MRVGELKKAGARFLASLLLLPTYSRALSNVQTLQTFLSPSEWSYLYASWLEADPSHVPISGVGPEPEIIGQRHRTRRLPVVTYESLLDPSNSTAGAFVLGASPYVLVGAMDHWDLSSFSEESLVTEFGDSRVDYYPQGMKEESVHPFFSDLRGALRNFEDPDGVYDTVDTR